MTNREHVESIIQVLEKQYGPDALYDYFSAFHDVVVLGHCRDEEDNPHLPTELPHHITYHLGSKGAQALVAQLKNTRGN